MISNLFKLLALVPASVAVISTSGHALEMKHLNNYSMQQLKNLIARPVAPAIAIFLKPGCNFYEHANGGGKNWRYLTDSQAQFQGDDVFIGKLNMSSTSNDRISSVRCDWQPDKRECGALLYTDANQSGASIYVLGSSGVLNMPASMNDQVSSVAVICDID